MCVSASARQSRAQCCAREFCCKILFTVVLHINAKPRTQDAQAQTVEKEGGERPQRQSEVSAGSQEGECDDGL